MMEIYNNENNKRRFYRIKLNNPICTKMTINNCHGRLIKTGVLDVCTTDIGPGGLSFLSTLLFPVDKGIIYNFKFSILGTVQSIKGIIVRQNELKKGVFGYGVMFNCDIREEQECIKLFNTLSIALKRNANNSESTFCDKVVYPCQK